MNNKDNINNKTNKANSNKSSEEVKNMSTIIKNTRPCAITESLTQSFKEVKLMQEGRLPRTSWDDFAKEMREMIKKDKKDEE